MPLEMNRLSREFVWWELTTANDLTGSTVEVALLLDPAAFPEEADWVAADLVGPQDPMGDGSWWARLLVGPAGTVTLAVGSYQGWLRIDDTPERPVRRTGVVDVT